MCQSSYAKMLEIKSTLFYVIVVAVSLAALIFIIIIIIIKVIKHPQ